jgi:hypothetical protein
MCCMAMHKCCVLRSIRTITAAAAAARSEHQSLLMLRTLQSLHLCSHLGAHTATATAATTAAAAATVELHTGGAHP